MSYETEARERKAERLAALAYERARRACITYDTKAGVERNASAMADDIILMVGHMEAVHWLEITKLYNRNQGPGAPRMGTPSTQTMALAEHKVIERARRSKTTWTR